MSKLLKFSFLLLFAVLVVWGILALVLPRPATILSSGDDGVFRVVLDPGHGGNDPGAVVGDAQEKDINLAVALLVREQLEGQEGIVVTMTREDDVFIQLTDRAEYANQEAADLYVSIHANALENNDTYAGIFTYYHPDKRSSKNIAQTVQTAISAASGGIDRGVRSGDYAVLRETAMPAVLIETGFMTCPEELAQLLDTEYQKSLARGIVQGILDCLKDM